ncbi:MAG: glycine zipper 2TM domain-containing protein [Pseudomonadota bacterium]
MQRFSSSRRLRTNDSKRSRGAPRGWSVGLAAAALLSVALPSIPANAAPGHAYEVEAPVVRVDPIVSTQRVVEPREECFETRRGYGVDRYERRGNPTGARILGGVVGGLIGNRFGGGDGRKVLTIAGAIAGASIADRAHKNRSTRDRYEPRYECEVVEEERLIERVDGYDVTYRYNGELYTRRMDFDPGDSLRIRVTHRPATTSRRYERSRRNGYRI